MYGSTESVQELKQIYMETRQEEEQEVQQRKKEQKKEKKGGDVNVVKKKRNPYGNCNGSDDCTWCGSSGVV